MAAIDDKFKKLNGSGCDICEHLETIKGLAAKCDHVTEFGIRAGVSTTAIIAGRPKRFITYDINLQPFTKPKFIEMATEVGVELVVIEGSSIEVEIEPTDMLMIDSRHVYSHLMKELTLHSPKVSKFIVMHDTEKFGSKPPGWDSKEPENNSRGLMTAIKDFLADSYEWRMKNHFKHNNGLTIIERITETPESV